MNAELTQEIYRRKIVIEALVDVLLGDEDGVDRERATVIQRVAMEIGYVRQHVIDTQGDDTHPAVLEVLKHAEDVLTKEAERRP